MQNLRGNVSMLVQCGIDGDDCKNVLVDCGKTFRAAVTRFFRKVVLAQVQISFDPAQFGVRSIDAIVLTHEHADATLGLDDIRDLQKYRFYVDPVTGVNGSSLHHLARHDACSARGGGPDRAARQRLHA